MMSLADAPSLRAAGIAVNGRSLADIELRALRFTGAILAATLLLQRFALPLSAKPASLVGPIGLALALLALARGTLALNRVRLAAYLGLAVCVMAGQAWRALEPGGGGEPNFQSLSQFLLLISFAVLSFAEPVDEKRFFRVVNLWFAVIAVAGVLQFCAQFFGVRVFAFTGILPDVILYEFGYNLQIPAGVGELLKSNGFFLVEPSTFSQVMALALIIEILAFRRTAYLVLFMAGLLLAFSGTGWIVLASFVVGAAIGMGWRGIATALVTVVLIGSLLGAGSFMLPEVADALNGRVDEITRPGTSGHLRFVTPFWALDDMLTERPSAALIGLGSGVSERLTLPYEYDVNTPIKVALDYGFPALLAYVLLFVGGGRRSPIQLGLMVPACTLFFFTGAYQQFPPVLFLILLLTSVARLRAAAEAPAASLGRERAIASA